MGAETEVQQQALELADQAQALTVETDAQYAEAGRFLRESCKAVLRAIDDTFDPICKAAHRAHKEAVAQKKKHAQPVQAAEKHVKQLMAAYADKRRREQREAEEKARQAAQERAQQEQLERAAQLEEQGRKAEATAALERAATAQVPYVVPAAPPPPKAEGVTTRTRYSFRIVDASKIDRRFLVVDEAKIRALVRSMKMDAAEVVGGIEVYQETEVAARA